MWGSTSPRSGQPVRISARRARAWLTSSDANLAIARSGSGELIGYAIIVETKLPRYGIVSWVTQLVVHADHRRANVAKILLFTTWKASDRFAWGIVTANPFAVRALEKATRRRCVPARIALHHRQLSQVGSEHVPYITQDTHFIVNTHESRVNTHFPLDHSQIPAMIANGESPDTPWLLGSLEEGWEWFAFTFQNQSQISLTTEELRDMLAASDEITRRAYTRMTMTTSHGWAKHAASEVAFAIDVLALSDGAALIDFGCGNGRHSFALAEAGYRAVGVDYVIRGNVHSKTTNPTFIEGDCRSLSLHQHFEGGLCLYDVVGSYADDADNEQILRNLARHLKPGAFCLISVMNLEATMARATQLFDVAKEPDRLLSLPPSSTMETTGNIFNPAFFLVDEPTGVVYRKEQFSRGQQLPEELLVRDRRYTKSTIASLCGRAGLDVVWSRFVGAGSWSVEGTAAHSKEILVLCRVPRS